MWWERVNISTAGWSRTWPACWSSRMILALSVKGPGFNSRIGPSKQRHNWLYFPLVGLPKCCSEHRRMKVVFEIVGYTD